MKKYIGIAMLVGALTFTSGCGTNLSKVAEEHSQMVMSSIETKAEAKTISVEKPNVEQLSTDLMDRIVQETDANYKVKEFQSIEEVEQHLQKVASKELASQIADVYFEERDGALYLIPTELFPWVNTDKPYELNQKSEFEYQLTQSNESDLYGTYTIKINFVYENNHWIIKNFEIQ
ncbi:IseA DL-endopeptidase inhibitor family protein [Pseudalkalibacillus hwajinpoensis]|uniref:IseA DL-endopeptidase inhibitor family protein n=1 Tax=Guptibacillus hwajinpoensis TaxID=208199 RepID=UPI001CFE6E37|nr:IseA DL-endopeptidase inhibitor family protein [Pseudalkalibacillus hwajinpoensis]